MPQDLSCRLIFLASPGGLTEERDACKEVISTYHATRSLSAGTTFFVHAWEDVPGGVGRPQDLINPNLDDCDYMLLLLGDRWGSPPGAGKFTSGTEEEFHRATELLADTKKPMRDILILFKTLDADRLRDPGPELKPVLDFRAKLQQSYSLMYENFDSITSLTNAIDRKLNRWSQPLGEKKPIFIALPTEDPGVSPDLTLSREQLLESARELAADGLLMQAEAAYANIIADDDPVVILEYAKFMRRTGRLSKALELNRSVLADRALLVSRHGAAIRHRVSALANIGVIQRKAGNLNDSIESLREAVETARKSEDPAHDMLCYALDNYGLTLLRAGLQDKALSVFDESDKTRLEFGSAAERAQSAINLGHIYIARGEHDRAGQLFADALSSLATDGDKHLRANALCGIAEAQLRADSAEGVAVLLTEAISLNDNLHNSDGVSIAHALMARLHIGAEAFEQAEESIRHAENESSKSGNSTGLGVVAWLKAEVARIKGDTPTARAHLEIATQETARSHSPTLTADIARSTHLLSLDT